MVPLLATLAFFVLIYVLLHLTRERVAKWPAALLIAISWLWFSSSRNPSAWIQLQGDGGYRTADTAYDEGSPIDRNVLAGLMLMGVVVLASRSKRSVAFLKANAPVVAFFVYCGLSVLWSDHPDISIKRWFRSLGDLIMVMVVLTSPDWGSAFKWIYTRLGCILIPLSFLFFRWFPALGRNYNPHDGHVSVTGVTDDKNLLGAICMLFALAALSSMIEAYRAKGRGRKGRLYGYGCVVGLALYLIHLANSATATACLIEGSGVLILSSMPSFYKRPKRIHWIVGAVLGITVVNLFFGSSLLALLGRNSTLTGRTELWTLCLTLVTNPLMGAGYESFWLGHRLERMWMYIPGVNQGHNGYLEIYLNLGWIGVAFLAALLISGYRNIFNSVRRGEVAGSLRLAYFVVVCITNCTEAGFKMMHPMWVALLMVVTARPALNVVQKQVEKRKKKKSIYIDSDEPSFAEALPSFSASS